jgi:hypothetical protein
MLRPAGATPKAESGNTHDRKFFSRNLSVYHTICTIICSYFRLFSYQQLHQHVTMSEVTQHNGLYKPLAKTGEIRLLYIESLEECGPNDYKLWCSIKHTNLHEKALDDVEVNERVRYEALSYEWGSEENPQHIWIRGHPTPVLIRENLYIALVALLLPDAWRPLWVDAICINQDDVGERNSQVTQMATITRAQIW